MAYAYDDDLDPGLLPPHLMEPLSPMSDAERAIEEAFNHADVFDVPVADAILQLAEPVEGEEPRWLVEDDDAAEWAMAHLAKATAELDALRARAHRWQAKIQAWFDQAAREPARTAEFMTAHLEWYGRRQRADEDRKSVALPSGKIGTRSSAAAVEIADKAAVVEWAKEFDIPGVVREEPQLSALQTATVIVEVIDQARLVLASGEVVVWEDGERVGWRDPSWPVRCPGPGDGWPTPAEATDLVAQVEVMASHPEVRRADLPGLAAVPGTRVRPERVTVTVKPS